MCILISDIALQKKEVKGNDKGLVRLSLDKDLYFNPTGLIKCSIAGTEQRSSNIREVLIKQFENNHFRYQPKGKVINPDRTRGECQEHLWNINAGQLHEMNFATFIIYFDQGGTSPNWRVNISMYQPYCNISTSMRMQNWIGK